MAAGELSAPDRAERGILSSLGCAGGVLWTLRTADQGLRAHHRRRAWDAAAAFFRRQHPGGPAVGAGACAAGRAGGICVAPIWRDSASYGDRQALLDTDGSRRRYDCRAGDLDDPPQAWRAHDRAESRADSKGFSIRFRPETSCGETPRRRPAVRTAGRLCGSITPSGKAPGTAVASD